MNPPSAHSSGPVWGILLLSALLSVGMFFYFERWQVGQAEEELVPLLVAARQIKAESQLHVQDVYVRRIPRKFFPLGGLVHPQQVEGRINRTELFPGDPLLEGKFYQAGERVMSP